MRVSLYMLGPLRGGCAILGCVGMSLLLFMHLGRYECTIRIGYSLLVFGHLGCWGRVAMYKKTALLLRLFLLTLPFHLLRNQRPLNSGGRQALGASLQPGSPLRSWPPVPLYLILRFVCPLEYLLVIVRCED